MTESCPGLVASGANHAGVALRRDEARITFVGHATYRKPEILR
jgi:hypothetical protein